MKKSAGILIFRKKNGKIQVFLVHPGGPFWKNKDLDSWSIPKGEITQTDIDAIYTNDNRINYPNDRPNKNLEFGHNSGKVFGQYSGNNLNPHFYVLLNTAIREFEEETGMVLTDEDKEKIFYLGEVKSKNKIVYVFALEKDLGDEIKIKSNLIKTEFGEFPEVDKGEYFDLEVAKEKLVNYQKELIEMIKLC
jgi:predicted NUDIX family NTP pyrophosphohydrolase